MKPLLMLALARVITTVVVVVSANKSIISIRDKAEDKTLAEFIYNEHSDTTNQ